MQSPAGDVASSSTGGEVDDEKVVFLVRHAQSEQNVATARLERGELSALGSILKLGYDAPVSDTGKQQLEDCLLYTSPSPRDS